jgi:hypothetical protein
MSAGQPTKLLRNLSSSLAAFVQPVADKLSSNTFCFCFLKNQIIYINEEEAT